jgi:pimeloyl-ACP methyl ester carboxylesterase
VTRSDVLGSQILNWRVPTFWNECRFSVFEHQGIKWRLSYWFTGGWRGGWVWDRVAKQRRENGHTVYTPTLSGLAERSHLLNMGVNLTTHIQEIVNLIKCEKLKDVVLCGHSYGRFVISGVADQIPECISSIVYFDAFVPQDGDSVFTLSSEAFQLYAIKAAAHLGGIACVTVPAASYALNEQDRAWFDEKTTPHPLASIA